MAYLNVYSEALRDGSITEREKAMLATFAESYGLNDDRVLFLEEYHNSDRSNPHDDSASAQAQTA